MAIDLSIIIPAYNKREILHKNLQSIFLELQLADFSYEIIVVNDGSTDGTAELLAQYSANHKAFSAFSTENSGPGAARNFGIRQAAGQVILFLQDDIIVRPGVLNNHYAWHQQYSEAHCVLQGAVFYHPEIITPFMHWLEHGGPQNRFYRLASGVVQQIGFLEAANLSVKRAFLCAGDLTLFAQDLAAFENIEFENKLRQKGMQLYYDLQTLAYHYHPVTFEDYMTRSYFNGQALGGILDKYPTGFGVLEAPTKTTVSRLFKRALTRMGSILPQAAFFGPLSTWYWKFSLYQAYIDGYKDYKKGL